MSPSEDRLDHLANRYIDGSLTDAELAELNDLLNADAAARTSFINELRFQSTLHSVMARGDAAQVSQKRKRRATVRRHALRRSKHVYWKQWAAAAACLLILTSVWFINRGQQGKTEVIAHITSAGDASITRNGKGIRVHADAVLKDGDMINGKTIFQYINEKTTIEMLAGTELKVENNKGTKLLYLNAGTLIADVGKQKEPMRFVTPHAITTVFGTRFKLSADNKRTRLEVTEGKVELRKGKEAVMVSSGQIATASIDGLSKPETLSLSRGLIGHWKLDELSGETAKDASGHGRDGILKNGPLWTQDAVVGSALSFDGEDDHVTFLDHSAFDFGARDFTVAFWVKKLAPSIGESRWDNAAGVSKWITGAAPGNNEWVLGLTEGEDDDRPIFTIESGITHYSAKGLKSLTLNQWHHLVGVRSDGNILLYVDGLLNDSAPVGAVSINNVDCRLSIARFHKFFTQGSFADVRLYERALNAAEVKSLARSRAVK